MLFEEHARGERFHGVAGPNADPGAIDDRPGIELGGDEMDRAAVFGHPGRERPVRAFEAPGTQAAAKGAR